MRLTDTRSLSLSRHGSAWWGFDGKFEEASETDVPERHVARSVETPKREDPESSIKLAHDIATS